MNKSFTFTAALAALALANTSHAALSARDIMVKNEDARKISDVTSNATLTTGGGTATSRVKQFTWWRKLLPDAVHFNTLTRFHQPAEIRGEGILFLEHPGDENDVLMYLPAFKKIRRVESQQQSNSFMGSEFSYADIATPHIDDYTYKLLREEACGETAAGVKCHVVEATPVSDAVKERTGFSKTVNWIRQDNYMGARGEYYDAQGALWKKMDSSQVREVDTAKHKWMAHQIRMVNQKNQKFTVLQFANSKVNAGIADAVFTQQNLAREK